MARRLITRMAKDAQHLVLALLVPAAFIPLFIEAAASPSSPKFAVPEHDTAPENPGRPVYEVRFASPPSLARFVHSPALTVMSNGHLLLVWYAGSGEKHADVTLYQSTFDPRQARWTAPRKLVDPAGIQAELGRYVYALGNPTLVTDRRGRTLLFFVTRWAAGWSTSSVNMKVSEDHGVTWTRAKRLVTNPYLNCGTLVRTRPFLHEDGSIGLPGYHELVGTFPEVFRISPEGELLGKTRISYGGSSLQPAVIIQDQNRAVALLRNKRARPKGERTDAKRILMATTADRGVHWSLPHALDLPNPNSSVAGTLLSDRSMLVAFNNATRGRGNLALARSVDGGRSWTVVATLEEGGNFSYPTLVQADDGVIHLVYAWNTTRLRHILFNLSWLDRQHR